MSFSMREEIKSILINSFQANVSYGEDLDKPKRRVGTRSDLQTLESQHAHTVDFTLLMLDSPGSMAELGTFSMIENIRSRLFVVVSNQFYGAESYIARGPLSLIASYNPSNIIYYNPYDKKRLKNSLLYPTCLYKYAKHVEKDEYKKMAINHFKSSKFKLNDYTNYFLPVREQFLRSAVVAAINVLYRPTFAELVSQLEIKPDDVSTALKYLIGPHVSKAAGGRYQAIHGYKDPILAPFCTTKLSRCRAKIIAAA